MSHRPRRRFWLETIGAGTCSAVALLTVISSDWIEAAFGIDPDHGSGSLEWGIVAVLVGVALCLAVAARTEWRRAVPASG